MTPVDDVEAYAKVIMEAINRVIELHDISHPYWRGVIQELKLDFERYKREKLGRNFYMDVAELLDELFRGLFL